MEGRVRAYRGPHVAGSAGRVELLEVAACRFLVGRTEQFRRAPQGECLESQPHREELPQLLDVERHHLGAVVRDVLGESERLELAHRLADGRDAHPEPAGDILQPQRRTWHQISMDDRLAQPLERSLGHRPVADGGVATRQCRRHESSVNHT